MFLLFLLQDASNSIKAETWINIATQLIIAIVGWVIVWRLTSRPVQVTLLAAQPEENEKKSAAHNGKDNPPTDSRLVQALPVVLFILLIQLSLNALDLYGLFTSATPPTKFHLVRAVNSTFWVCQSAAMIFWLLHLRKTYKSTLPPPAGGELPADVPADEAATPPAEVTKDKK